MALTDRFQRLDILDGARRGETFRHVEDGFLRQSAAFLAAVRGAGPWMMDFLEGTIPSIMVQRALDSARSERREAVDCRAFLETGG